MLERWLAEAEAARDASRAVDCRVLLRRHPDHDGPPRRAGGRTGGRTGEAAEEGAEQAAGPRGTRGGAAR
ncbi:hypothetical protein SALCHL_002461 [Streptomyces albus subsp. chlorinus]|uniref:hypothetical protein n=1 Tax=Streptomyces albus TaxID=1888 RepID=UPI001570A2D4|nr:hypothetical protein [Streptomyces albus]